MNYDAFHRWVLERVEDLVEFGVSRREAAHLLTALELGAIADEARNRADNQFLLDFKRCGSAAMAERLGLTKGAVRARRNALLKKRKPVAPALTQTG